MAGFNEGCSRKRTRQNLIKQCKHAQKILNLGMMSADALQCSGGHLDSPRYLKNIADIPYYTDHLYLQTTFDITYSQIPTHIPTAGFLTPFRKLLPIPLSLCVLESVPSAVGHCLYSGFHLRPRSPQPHYYFRDIIRVPALLKAPDFLVGYPASSQNIHLQTQSTHSFNGNFHLDKARNSCASHPLPRFGYSTRYAFMQMVADGLVEQHRIVGEKRNF